MKAVTLVFVPLLAVSAATAEPNPEASHPAWPSESATPAEVHIEVEPEVQEPTAPHTVAEDVDLSLERDLIDSANAALKAGDYATARSVVEEAVTLLLERPAEEQNSAWLSLLDSAGVTAINAQDARTAHTAYSSLFEIRSRTLSSDDLQLQSTRRNLGVALTLLGDHSRAAILFEQSLEIASRALAPDSPDLQSAREYLAITCYHAGNLLRARELLEQSLEVRTRTLPPDHVKLQHARGNLALTLRGLGDHNAACVLEGQVLSSLVRTLPDDHPDLAMARQNLGLTLLDLGDVAGARALLEKVVEVCSRILPSDHPNLRLARENLAAALQLVGDFEGALALQELGMDAEARERPADHPERVNAQHLALTLKALGQTARAREVEEQLLEARLNGSDPDSRALREVRGNLADTLMLVGDVEGAFALQEKAVESSERTLPALHPDLQRARLSLARIIARLACVRAGKAAAGMADREALRMRSAELVTVATRGLTEAAREALMMASPREAETRCSFQATRLSYPISFGNGIGVFAPSTEFDRDAFVLSETTRSAALTSAGLMRLSARDPKCGELRKSLREQSAAFASLAQMGTTSEQYRAAIERRDLTQREIVEMTRQASGGSFAGLRFEVDALAGKLEEREAVVGLRRFESASVDAEEETVGVNLCAFVLRRAATGASTAPRATILTRVDLGPMAPIAELVRAWREQLGARAGRGLAAGVTQSGDDERVLAARLRQLVLDPLLPALADSSRVIVALDDILHLVPIEALPLEADAEGRVALVGDRWRIEIRCTLTELLAPTPRPTGREVLLALGGAAFDDEPLETAAAEPEPEPEARHRDAEVATILRGGAFASGFADLPYTGVEARDIAELFARNASANAKSVVLEKRKASRAALEELAAEARFLHIATHGWYASDSIRSWRDAEPLDRQAGLRLRASGEEQVRGLSPMLLCGLALAGANLPENTFGRAPGLITAEELSALDLSGCELAVLSACDTNVGEQYAGQGVASLQRALHMAGARSVITSLWKVPDEATRELMVDFYRRIWVEKKPKWQALWEAKMKLRNAVDERGKPKYSTRDWAAWMLTGEPE